MSNSDSAITSPEHLRDRRSQRSSTPRDRVCRTCKACRQKKIKCDGQRPKCSCCCRKSIECIYLQDARRSGARLRREGIGALQKEIQELRQQLHDHSGDSVARSVRSQDGPDVQFSEAFSGQPMESRVLTPTTDYALPGIHSLLSDEVTSMSQLTPESLRPPSTNAAATDVSITVGESVRSRSASPMIPSRGTPEADGTALDSFRDYGATSLLHDKSSKTFLPSQPSDCNQGSLVTKETIRNQLLANAAVRRQEEAALHSSPSLLSKIDFDGVPADIALHLLDLHWNRQHLSYLLTYRPAIMDSLVRNGPYINKLLLNAIYFQSSLYSDRVGLLRKDPKDPQTMGEAFYDRFKSLLVHHIDQPTIPTVVGLLTCGAVLVPRGHQSAGWVLCGMAYRMITDLGCHLDLQPSTVRTKTKSQLDNIDIEIRRRIYWAAYVGDKLQSLFLGRPPALTESLGQVPEEYLDTYEEMEEWKPYVDPEAFPFDSSVPAYRGRPCYAVSTFRCLLQVCRIISRIIETFYTNSKPESHDFSSELNRKSLIQKRDEVRALLHQYKNNVPSELQFDPGIDAPPPPHQFTPHALYWASVILTEQAFLDQDFSEYNTSSESLPLIAQEESKRRCIEAALCIWKLVESYKRTFTLRRAQYGISYATYCAVLVILRHTDQDCDEYIECIRFFWQALIEFQRGCNYGLKRPLKLLKSLMSRIERVSKSINMDSMDATAPIPSQLDLSTCQADIDSLFKTSGAAENDDTWMAELFNDGMGGSSLTDHTLFGIADDNLLGVYT